MELAFIQEDLKMGIIGLKKTSFISAINNNQDRNFWVARLLSKSGVFAGYFCTFTNDTHEYHLNNDKGVVRIFKTIDAAVKFYDEIILDDGSVLISVTLGLR